MTMKKVVNYSTRVVFPVPDSKPGEDGFIANMPLFANLAHLSRPDCPVTVRSFDVNRNLKQSAELLARRLSGDPLVLTARGPTTGERYVAFSVDDAAAKYKYMGLCTAPSLSPSQKAIHAVSMGGASHTEKVWSGEVTIQLQGHLDSLTQYFSEEPVSGNRFGFFIARHGTSDVPKTVDVRLDNSELRLLPFCTASNIYHAATQAPARFSAFPIGETKYRSVADAAGYNQVNPLLRGITQAQRDALATPAGTIASATFLKHLALLSPINSNQVDGITASGRCFGDFHVFDGDLARPRPITPSETELRNRYLSSRDYGLGERWIIAHDVSMSVVYPVGMFEVVEGDTRAPPMHMLSAIHDDTSQIRVYPRGVDVCLDCFAW
jgi:hypothetical protein